MEPRSQITTEAIAIKFTGQLASYSLQYRAGSGLHWASFRRISAVQSPSNMKAQTSSIWESPAINGSGTIPYLITATSTRRWDVSAQPRLNLVQICYQVFWMSNFPIYFDDDKFFSQVSSMFLPASLEPPLLLVFLIFISRMMLTWTLSTVWIHRKRNTSFH